MDIFNNDIGITYCWNCYPSITINAVIAHEIMSKLNNGELRYLSPINLTIYPAYHPVSCTTCTNGIGPNTVLKPTNQ